MRWLTYRYKLRIRQRRRRIVVEAFQLDYERAVAEKLEPEAIRDLRRSEQWAVDLIDEEIDTLISDYYREQASRLLIPLPPLNADDDPDGCWERNHQLGNLVLTRKGIFQIRSAIRDEKSARRDSILVWVTPVLGVIGAITGLVAVWKN